MGKQDKHPPGLYVLFFTEMWERFGFYTMGAMFVLYLRSETQGFGWSSARAADLNSWYLMFVYASPLVGGWLADRFLGYRNCVLIGGLIFMVGYMLFTVHSLTMVYAALTFLVIGNGFFKPNVSAMVGHLYPEGSPLKDRAFNIFYMGINIGAFFAPVIAEYVSGKFGFGPAFGVAAAGMVISVTILWTCRRYVTGAGGQPAPTPGSSAEAPLRPPSPIDAIPNSRRIGALIVIFLIVIVFWMVFHQNSSTLVFWANDNTDWTWMNSVTGFEISGILANAINAFFVVAFTFPLVWVWKRLDARGLEPSTPTKIALGMFLTAVSFVILWWGARVGEAEPVTPEMIATGEFRVTDLTLERLKAEGVPADVLEKLEAKDADKKYIIKDRKFGTDKKLSQALDTIKFNLKSNGMSDEDWNKIKDVKVKEDGSLDGDRKLSDALGGVTADLKGQGVSDKVLDAMRSYENKTFTGREKLHDNLERVAGGQSLSQYDYAIMKNAYLFKVSPLWLIIAYAVVTLGELMLSPMGLSLVSKVAPVHMRGLMMGGWFLATAIGNKLTAIGVYWDQWTHSAFFILLSGMALFMAIVLVLLLRPLKKAMPGV